MDEPQPEPLDIPAEWLAEFEAAARRPLSERFKYAFIKTYKPVMDDAKFRSFDTMEEYRQWCEKELPDWLGYGRADERLKTSKAAKNRRTPKRKREG